MQNLRSAVLVVLQVIHTSLRLLGVYQAGAIADEAGGRRLRLAAIAIGKIGELWQSSSVA